MVRLAHSSSVLPVAVVFLLGVCTVTKGPSGLYTEFVFPTPAACRPPITCVDHVWTEVYSPISVALAALRLMRGRLRQAPAL